LGKSRKKHYEKMPGSDVFFQSAFFNQRIYEMYRQWLDALALSRFKWINLPASCDERYLEYNLFFQGMATIAFPKNAEDMVYSMQLVYQGAPNVYDKPSKWDALGNNGFRFSVDDTNGVPIFDNRMRLPMAGHMDMYARRLTTIDRTLDINMLQQRTPFVITGPQEKTADVANVMKSIAGGDPAVVGYSQLTEHIKVEAIQTGVPCIAGDIDAAKRSLWDDIYRFLGIPSVEQKSERMITGEVKSQNASSEIMSLDPLNCRREAADAWNRLCYHTASAADQKPVEVIWAQDFRTDNFEASNNLLTQMEGNDA
jgi:hypothetical protein